MADKKISELPILGYYGGQPQGDITASGVGLYPQNIVPVVVGGTTYQISLQNFTKYVTQYNATTGSNTFIGNQTIQGNIISTGDVTVQGKLTAQEVHTEITSASIIFESGSTIFGNSVDDTHQFTGIVSINGASINNQSDRIHQATASLQQFTASQDQRNLVISQITSSLYSQLERVYQTTASLNGFSGSQDSRNFVISQFTSSTDAHIVGISTYTSSLEAQLRRVYQTTSSLNIFTGSQDGRNFVISQFTSSTDAHIVGVSTYTSSLEAQLRRVYQTTASLNQFTGSQDSRNFVISQFTSSTDNHILGISIYTASIDSSIVNASAVTASIFAQLQRVYQTTASLNGFSGSQDSRNFVISQFTSSTDNHIVGISAFTSSQLAVNLGNSIVTSSLNQFSASARIELNSIEAYTASLKSAISVSGTSVQIIGDLNVNKLNVNYVSSSVLVTSGSNIFGDQSTDKHEFTGSVYLQNNIIGSADIQANKFVFTDGVVNTNVGGQKIVGTSGNILYLYTGTSGLYINNQANTAQNVTITDAGVVTTRGKLTVGASGNDQDIAFGGSNSKLDWAGTGAQIQYSVGALQFSSVGTTNNMVLQMNAGALFNAGITGSLMATNGVVSSSLQIQNYNKFALTASANTFYGTQSVTGSVKISGSIDDISYIDFDLKDNTGAIGRLGWDDGEGTLKIGLSGGNVNIPIGVTNFETAYNADSSSISKGDVVRVSGAQGNRVAVKKANNLNDDGSATTVALAAETIGVGAEGKVITTGLLKGIDTTAFGEGDLLYLSSTPGGITNIKPHAPFHEVRIGVAQRIHASVGIVNVKVDNGYEIDELHNVLIHTASLAHKQLLAYSGSVWANQTISNLGIAETASLNPVLAYTASLKAAAIVSSSQQIKDYYTFAQTASADTIFYGNVTSSKFNVSTFGGTTDIYHTGGGHTVITNSTSNKDINYQTTGTGEHYFNSDINITGGNLVIATAGNGIDFSANASAAGMTSELLNDYETGTWSPQIYYQNSTDQSNSSNVTQVGTYTKIGNVVVASGVLQWTVTGSPANDNIGIKNFPFTSKAGSDYYWWGNVWMGNAGSYPTDGYILSMQQNASMALFYDTRTDTGNYGDDIGATGTKTTRFTVTYLSAT